MKHLFIVNPAAGGRDQTEAVASQVGLAFSGHSGGYEIYTTRTPMEAADKIRQESALANELRVYACGGDGTLNECVCAAMECGNVAVGCFPLGTGNDFVKIFGLGQSSFRDAGALIGGEVRHFDLLRCNSRYCLNIFSVGIDARIGTDVHKYSRIPFAGGKAAYLASAAVNWIKGVRQPLRMECNGKLYYGDFNLVCCCNGQYYGGSFHPVPEARPDDGVMDILIVKGVDRFHFARLIGTYAKGGYAAMPEYITHLRTGRIHIEAEEEIVANIDGEAMLAKKMDIELLPKALPFIVPKGADICSAAEA